MDSASKDILAILVTLMCVVISKECKLYTMKVVCTSSFKREGFVMVYFSQTSLCCLFEDTYINYLIIFICISMYVVTVISIFIM